MGTPQCSEIEAHQERAAGHGAAEDQRVEAHHPAAERVGRA